MSRAGDPPCMRLVPADMLPDRAARPTPLALLGARKLISSGRAAGSVRRRRFAEGPVAIASRARVAPSIVRWDAAAAEVPTRADRRSVREPRDFVCAIAAMRAERRRVNECEAPV